MPGFGFRSAKIALLALLVWGGSASAQVRIKDIAEFEGVRDNQLVGYGLVVGLPGTGDRLRSAIFTRQSLVGMLERLGVNTRDQEALRAENEALARLDMTRAAALATAKVQASDAFAAATNAAGRGRRARSASRRRGWRGTCGTSRRRTGGCWSGPSRRSRG